MTSGPTAILSPEEIEAFARDVIAETRAGQTQVIPPGLHRLRNAQARQIESARALLEIVAERCLSNEVALEILSEVIRSHDRDVQVLSALGSCLEAARDIDDLNAAPPDHPVFRTAVEKLEALVKEYEGQPREEMILEGLATAARMLARQRDAVAESSYRKLTELNPGKSAYHYNLGLFYKTRGRFADGVSSNQKAVNLRDEVNEATEWNLGICSTGAGDGATALDVWKRMGQTIEMGRFGLPEGRYPTCKVKLAERPLAQRSFETDDPGAEETIWIERLSPCHGVIRSVLYGSLGVDYGDVILFDGAPITYHSYGESRVPVFPHLATLLRRNYQLFDFAGTQDAARQLADISADLEGDAVVYSHSESFRILCANCWRDPDLDHERHEEVNHYVVTGRIAAPPGIAPPRLLDMVDRATAKRERCHLYAPDLCAAAGLMEREQVDRRRFAMLTGS